MSMLHFVGGEKGGVGKSVFSRLLSQYFLDNNLSYMGLDADQSHPSLTRYYPDFTQALQLDVFESVDNIMELALSYERQVLVDLPAQSERFLEHWISESGVLELCEEMEIPLIYWYVVDDGRDSAQLLQAFLAKYHKSVQCVVVKNRGRGSDFSEIEAMPIFTQEQIQQICLPALHAETLHKVDKFNFSFWSAANAKDNTAPHLSMMERQRLKVWLRKVYTELDKVLKGKCLQGSAS